MNDTTVPPRSIELMSRHDTALLVVDVQERLLPLIDNSERMVWNIRRLIDAATLLGLPLAATEQYPQGLGGTTPALVERLGEIAEKRRFSCGQVTSILGPWTEAGTNKILVVGIEAHVCVQQTVLDTMAQGFTVFVAVDAIASRHELDREYALRRMESCGATLTTTEAAVFEWCETSEAAEFKQISQLVQEVFPGS
jgi:nicotinamidase-related amidase